MCGSIEKQCKFAYGPRWPRPSDLESISLLAAIVPEVVKCMKEYWGGRSLVAINRAPAPQPPETLRCRRLVGVISSD